MRRFRLTTISKFLLVILVIGIFGGGIFWGLKSGIIKTTKSNDTSVNTEADSPNVSKDTELIKFDTKPSKENAADLADVDGNIVNTDKEQTSTINLSLDEWIGWKPIIDANGGLSTEDGSIYDKLGIDVNISIINDATQSSNALISGKLDAAGYTINRTAFLSTKFKSAGIDVVMPYITNFSNGGDGIIASTKIKTVKDMVEAKVGVPQFSEAHTLVVWFVNQSDDLSDSEKKKIIDNLVFFDTPDDAAKAFFAGKIDVAATWEPYLTQAQSMSDAHVLFSTKSSSSLVMDGILFNNEFAKANPDVMQKFIDGALQAGNLYEKEFDAIRSVMPMYSVSSDDEILEGCKGAKLMTYADNLEVFTGSAATIYSSMCDVWNSIGEEADKSLLDTLYDDAYITALESKYQESEVTKTDAVVKVTEDNEKNC